MKSILLSIKPKYVELIARGKKTIEVRKSAPKEVPFKVYIYCTKTKNKWSLCDYEGAYQNSKGEIVYAQQHIIGEFICDKVERFSAGSLRSDDIEKLACLSYNEMIGYFYKPEELDGKTVKQGFAWHISNLKIYDKPKELSEFFRPCPTKEKGDCLSCDCLADNDYGGVCTNNLTRPPQSWCYVEELEK